MNPSAKVGDLYRSSAGRHVRIIRIKHGMPFHVAGKVAGYQDSRATLIEVTRTGKRKKATRSYDREPFHSVLRGDAMAPGYEFITNLKTDRTEEIDMATKKNTAKKTSKKTTAAKKPAAKKNAAKGTAKKKPAAKPAKEAKEYKPREGSFAAVVLAHFRKASSKGKWFTRAELQTKLQQADWAEDWPCQQVLFSLTSYKGLLKKEHRDGQVCYSLA